MISKSIRIIGSTKDNRNKIIGDLNEVILKSGAWVLDFKVFSNKSINILFEIPVRNVHKLHQNLLEINIKLNQESHNILKNTDDNQKKLSDDSIFDLIGTLQITFIHNDTDMRIKVPPLEL